MGRYDISTRLHAWITWVSPYNALKSMKFRFLGVKSFLNANINSKNIVKILKCAFSSHCLNLK